jgi:hypothetical protein
MTYSASYDRNTKILSTVVCLGLLAVIVIVHNLVLTCLSLLVIVLCFAYSPRGYVLAGRSILVKRLAGTIRIPIDELREARRATPDDFRGGIRLWGSGGLFGYYGLFSTAKLGRSSWYVTESKQRRGCDHSFENFAVQPRRGGSIPGCDPGGGPGHGRHALTRERRRSTGEEREEILSCQSRIVRQT